MCPFSSPPRDDRATGSHVVLEMLLVRLDAFSCLLIAVAARRRRHDDGQREPRSRGFERQPVGAIRDADGRRHRACTPSGSGARRRQPADDSAQRCDWRGRRRCADERQHGRRRDRWQSRLRAFTPTRPQRHPNQPRNDDRGTELANHGFAERDWRRGQHEHG